MFKLVTGLVESNKKKKTLLGIDLSLFVIGVHEKFLILEADKTPVLCLFIYSSVLTYM